MKVTIKTDNRNRKTEKQILIGVELVPLLRIVDMELVQKVINIIQTPKKEEPKRLEFVLAPDDEDDDHYLKNMDLEHLDKELQRLKETFKTIEEKDLEEILIKNGGHAGRTKKAIFKKYGESLQKEKEDFEKRFPGALRHMSIQCAFGVVPELIIYTWHLGYDPKYVKEPWGIMKGGEFLQAVSCQVGYCTDDIPEHYPNDDYFWDLASKGDSPHCEGDWGSDPDHVYDEWHVSNPKQVLPTKRELMNILDGFKIPLLGTIHFYDSDEKKRGIYIGKSAVPGQYKRKLPSDWTRGSSDEYNGLYYYTKKNEDGTKETPQWKHPVDENIDR